MYAETKFLLPNTAYYYRTINSLCNAPWGVSILRESMQLYARHIKIQFSGEESLLKFSNNSCLFTNNQLCLLLCLQVATCGFRLKRNSTEYFVLFFTDIMLFYVIPLLVSVVLYSLIAKMLLSKVSDKFVNYRQFKAKHFFRISGSK